MRTKKASPLKAKNIQAVKRKNIQTKKTTIKKVKKDVKIPYHQKPENMSLEEWQIALRKQVAKETVFSLENIGGQAVFSDYLVKNPLTKQTYKVAIRDNAKGLNFCSCPDFKTNLLGTCKHIEFVLDKINNIPAKKKLMKEGFHPEYSSLSIRYGTERKIYLRIGTENETEIKKLAKKYFNEHSFLKDNAYQEIDIFLSDVKKLNAEFRAYDDAVQFIIEKRDRTKREKIITEQYANQPEKLDSLIKTTLYPYQKAGVLFAAKAGRCLIADDMGLGKTIQAIATCELLIKEFYLDSILIICPTSLKYQWKSEIKKFTGCDALVIEGMPHLRKEKYEANYTYKIISHHLAKNDLEEIRRLSPGMVILDEAQRIKNWKTKIAQAVKTISSKYALVLTGTPLENKIEEIHSIMQFVDNFRLGPLYKFLNKHQVADSHGKVIGYQHLNDINKTLNEVLIRRTKVEIADQLPERIDNNFFVELTPKQKELHANYYEEVCRLVNKWKKFRFLSEEDRQKLLICLNCMRMVSDSSYILDQKTRHDTKIAELMSILGDLFENKNQKVVIFSQWERMTRLVAQDLDAMNIKYEYLHGGIPGHKRGILLDNFRNDPESRVFLSTDAGGTGLNLQSANYIINLDIPWNPAILEQRIARVHRLGQKETVNVINFISTGSIEQRILALLGFKKSMFEGVLDMGNDSVFMSEDRFSQFMRTVEAVAEAPVDESEETEHAAETESEIFVEEEESMPFASAILQPEESLENQEKPQTQFQNTSAGESLDFNDLIKKGIDFLSQLSESLKPDTNGNERKSNEGLIREDEKTGEKYLRIPLKNEQFISKLAKGFGAFIDAMSR
ncbi:MAG TPA: ATP-dependent helicase [Bacteroidales bacterium]|nr:ATP-dependent helicase [Bacteroidales bacterium]